MYTKRSLVTHKMNPLELAVARLNEAQSALEHEDTVTALELIERVKLLIRSPSVQRRMRDAV